MEQDGLSVQSRERLSEVKDSPPCSSDPQAPTPPGRSETPKVQIRGEVPLTSEEQICDDRFGYGLVRKWAATKKTICRGASTVTCYEHQQVNHWRTDTFCEGTNIVVDFSKVSGVHSRDDTEPPRDGLYHTFFPGAFSGDCAKTDAWRDDMFILQHKEMMTAFVEGPPPSNVTVERTPAFFLTRDEDAHNFFHGGADVVNAFLVKEILNLDTSSLQVVLFDRNNDGPLGPLYKQAFSPSFPMRRATDYAGPVKFERLVWSLPAKASPYWTDTNVAVPCGRSAFFQQFSRHILSSFGLWDVPPPPRPTVLMSFRRRTATRNVGRIISNEAELEAVLAEGTDMDVKSIDLATLPIWEQLDLVRKSNILIGMHGAGLTHAFFLAQEAVVVELHPSYRADRHFRNAARYAGKVYFPWRSKTAPTYQGTSDATRVDPVEFRALVDGAVRIARSFGVGLKECGLRCPETLVHARR